MNIHRFLAFLTDHPNMSVRVATHAKESFKNNIQDFTRPLTNVRYDGLLVVEYLDESAQELQSQEVYKLVNHYNKNKMESIASILKFNLSQEYTRTSPIIECEIIDRTLVIFSEMALPN